MTQSISQDRPLFSKALGDSWHNVDELVRAHYSLVPAHGDTFTLRGVMTVSYPLLALPLLAFVRLFGGLVLVRGNQLSVTVRNETRLGDPNLYWQRRFHAPGRTRTIRFNSHMEADGKCGLIEYVNPFIGLKMKIEEDQGGILYTGNGYVFRLGRLQIPVPGELLLGRARIVERQIASKQIEMSLDIDHPWWGRVYHYSGTFRQEEISQT